MWTISVVLGVLACIALGASILRAARALGESIDAFSLPLERYLTRRPPGDLTRLAHDRLHDVEAHLKRLTLAVEEGIERVARAETRVAKTVSSARKLVAASGLEHAGIEAEAAEIRERDAEPSEPEEMQLVPGVLDDNRPSGIPGISVGQYRELIGG